MSGGPPQYRYTIGTPSPEPGRITTSPRELRDIGIAYAVLTADIFLILSGSTLLSQASGIGFVWSLPTLILAAVAALTGFLLHELAHKIAAERRHAWAEFRMFPGGLVLSLFTSLLGFLFAAPGATVVGGMRSTREWGETSLAGPLTNFGFAASFFAASDLVGITGSLGVVYQALVILAFFNGWFATFNLIPLGPLDGRKVLGWSPFAWTASIVGSGVVTILAFGTNILGHPLFV
ncbi:MAG: hypothetical protein QXG65_06175 [Thermoplasmata archaeon]